MDKKQVLIVILLVVVIVGAFAEASVTLNNETIKRTYTTGENIEGKIKVRFTGEPASSIIKSNFLGEISLFSLLNANNYEEGVEYNCSYPGCGDTYEAKGEVNRVQIINGSDSFAGFVINDADVSIEELDLVISSSNGPSCTTPIRIIPLDNKDIELSAIDYVKSELSCPIESNGCFDNSLQILSYKDVILTPQPSCTKIYLKSAPSYELGAIINATNNQSKIIFELFDNESNFLDSCTVNSPGLGKQTAKCIVNWSIISESDHVVCLYAESDNREYSIRSEQSSPSCGGSGLEFNPKRDYEVFVRPLAFNSIRNLSISKTLNEIYGILLAEEADLYIESIYGRDCSDGCIIPIKIKGINQELSIINSTLIYRSGNEVIQGGAVNRLDGSPSQISSNGPLNIELSHAKFNIPVDSNQKNLQIYWRADPLFSTAIPITLKKGFEFSIRPIFVNIGIPTMFTIISNVNISSSVWEFGDGSPEVGTSGNKAIYRYSEIGNYTLMVSARGPQGASVTKEIEINVGNASSSVNQLINQSKSNIIRIKKSMAVLSVPARNLLDERLNISLQEKNIAELENISRSGLNESDYVGLIEQITNLNIPYDIQISERGLVPLELGFSAIAPEYSVGLSNESISEEKLDELKLNLIDWNNRNYKSSVEYSIISSLDESGDKTPIATSFKINLEKIGNYKSRSFSIGEREFPRGTLIALITILIVAALIIYIALQEWYKRRYERYLFKSSDDIYNLIHFIYNARQTGNEDNSTRKKIIDNGWNREQASYAFKKADGKRTGMFEIPIFRSIEKRKILEEMEKRRMGGERKVY